jgi:hypothetical protein
MKRGLIVSLILLVLVIQLASADIVISQQPKEFYNLGEIVVTPIKIATLGGTNDFFTIKLICNGQETEVHKEYVAIIAGDEKAITSTIPLISTFTSGRTSGTCKLKASLGEEFILTENFKITNKLTVKPLSDQFELDPGEELIIEGEAIKENQQAATGFVEITISGEEGEIVAETTDTVNGGYFFATISLPENLGSGKYLVKARVYEKDSEDKITNQGETSYYITVSQIPTNLEIFVENKEITPGTSIKAKAILRDQAGDNIPASTIITIRDSLDKILEETDKATDEFLEYSTTYNTPPQELKITASSGQLTTGETRVRIIEYQKIQTVLANRTLTVENRGNVYYNQSILVKIGTETRTINLNLKVNEQEKFVLTAPDGEYEVEVISEGEAQVTSRVMLTGNAIDIKKVGEGVIKVARNPIVWIFIIIVLIVVAYMFFKKGYKRSFFGKMPKLRKEKKLGQKAEEKIESSGELIKTKNKAELSLSIKGDKQPASVVCLKIKNIEEIKSKKSGADETLQRIVTKAEEQKAAVYENKESIFFIFSPANSKTFKNEITAVKFSQEMQRILREHNKKYKQLIGFGISINYGNIVANKDKESMKFMSMGTLITASKKIASISKGEVLLSQKINERLKHDVKTVPQEKEGIKVFTIKEVMNKKDHSNFISGFLQRLEDGEKK